MSRLIHQYSYPILIDMSPFRTDGNAAPAVKSPATTYTPTKEQCDLFLKRRKSKPTVRIRVAAKCPTHRKLPKSKETTFSKGLDDKTPKKSCCTPTKEQVDLFGEIRAFSKGLDHKTPKKSCCTPTKEQVDLFGEIRVFLEEALVNEMKLDWKELLVQGFFYEKRTEEPFSGILKKKKLVHRAGLN